MARVCNQCGSLLIEVNQISRKNEHQLSAITTTSFRCTDPSCQERIDKRVEELRQQRELLAQKAAAKFLKPKATV